MVLGFPRPLKRLFVFTVDAILCIGAVYFAFYLRLGYWVASFTGLGGHVEDDSGMAGRQKVTCQ